MYDPVQGCRNEDHTEVRMVARDVRSYLESVDVGYENDEGAELCAACAFRWGNG